MYNHSHIKWKHREEVNISTGFGTILIIMFISFRIEMLLRIPEYVCESPVNTGTRWMRSYRLNGRSSATQLLRKCLSERHKGLLLWLQRANLFRPFKITTCKIIYVILLRRKMVFPYTLTLIYAYQSIYVSLLNLANKNGFAPSPIMQFIISFHSSSE